MYKLPKLETESESTQRRQRKRCPGDGVTTALNRLCPLILKNGNVRLLVNCFRDEGSDTTCINENLVEELGVRGRKEPVIVNDANAQRVKFMSMSFQVGLESIDGEVKRIISAKTSQKICGGMKPINWWKIKHKWSHLRDISFPQLPQRRTIDVFLGANNTN